MAAVIEGNREIFREIIRTSGIPVIVEFYATWCPKCAMMTDLVEEFAEEQAGKMLVCRIDVEREKEIAEQYGVERVPLFVCFCNGKAEKAISGIVSKNVLEDLSV